MRYGRKRNELGDAGMRNTGERGMSTAYREIRFDSKPISEIDLKQETHMKVASAAEIFAMKGETRRLGGAVQQVRKIIFGEKCISLKTDFSNQFLDKARLQKRRKWEIVWRSMRRNQHEEIQSIYETIMLWNFVTQNRFLKFVLGRYADAGDQ